MKQLIAQLRIQLQVATPGPWELDNAIPKGFSNDNIAVQQKNESVWPAEFCHSIEDANLIVALRNNASALLDRLEALEVENSELHEKHSYALLGNQHLQERVEALEAIAKAAYDAQCESTTGIITTELHVALEHLNVTKEK